MAITNYLASGKTRVPFCGGDCCGTKFGRMHINHALRPQSSAPKRKMRRYARHAERRLIRREIHSELILWNGGWDEPDYTDGPEEQYAYDIDDYLDKQGYDLDYDPLDGLYEEYDEPLDYYRRPVSYNSYVEDDAINRIHKTMREAFQNGEISREKYHALTDVLFR